jgi:vacuolar-type H+-ATPase subunit I/STV1
MLNRRPHEHTTWGILILVFSVLSVFGSMMGDFSIGVLLSLIGGILAIIWKP